MLYKMDSLRYKYFHSYKRYFENIRDILEKYFCFKFYLQQQQKVYSIYRFVAKQNVYVYFNKYTL